MERWLPWVLLALNVAALVWYGGRLVERLHAVIERLEKVETNCDDVPTIKALLDAGLGGRRTYRAPRATSDDAGRPFKAHGNAGALSDAAPDR